jgi:hypothetical protein
MQTNHAKGNTQNDTKIEETSTEQNLQMYEPPEADEEFSSDEKIFINEVFKLLENGVIDLHIPSTLLNKSIYDQANEEIQGMADRSAINFLAKIRELDDLREISGNDKYYIKPTYQAKYVVSMFKYRKEEFEKQYGDMFII